MNKRNLLFVAFVVAAVLLVFLVVRNRDGTYKSVASIRLKWLHQAQFAGFYAAQAKGFYEQEGVSVELKPGGVEFPAIGNVVSGADKFGVAGADQVLIHREKGAPIVAVAVIYRATPMVLFSFQENGITKADQLIGRRVGVKLGGNEELTYRAILGAAHVDSKRIKEIPVKYDMTPLFDGLVDVWPGYLINEVLTARERGKQVNIISPKQYGLSMYADTLFTTEETITREPELVAKVVRAAMRGWEYAATHPEEAARFGLNYDAKLNYPHELAMMRESLQLLKPDDRPIGWMDRPEWEALQTLLLEQGFLKNRLDLTKVVDLHFIGTYYNGRKP